MTEGNPLDAAMNFAAQMNQAQFNAAKLKIEWKEYDHLFSVESLNPVSAFELMKKVKEVAKKELENQPKKKSEKK